MDEQLICELHKTLAAFCRRHIAGQMPELGHKARDVGHTNAVWHVLKHQLVIGRVAMSAHCFSSGIYLGSQETLSALIHA